MALFHRLKNLWQRDAHDREIEAELRSHLEMRSDEGIAGGMAPRDAREDARRRFGNVTLQKERAREADLAIWLETLAQDVVFGLRVLRKNPGFAAVAILTLALGVGANAAIFSVVNAVLLRPLPYPNPSQLFVIQETSPQQAHLSVSYPNFQDWSAQQDVFSDMAIYRTQSLNLTGLGEPEHVRAAVATSQLFPMLGFTPVAGRAFTAQDDDASAAPAVLLSYSFWKQHFGGDPSVAGKAIRLDDREYTIVGVVSDSPSIPRNAALWTNFGLQAARPEMHRRNNHMGYAAIVRLKEGVTAAQACAEMDAIAGRIAAANPVTNAGWGISFNAMLDTMVGNYRGELLMLAAAVGLVLLIACANLANLLYARGVTRERELAVRAALGAGRGRLARQLFTESILLAMLGGAAGVALAYFSQRTIVALSPAGAARFPETRVDFAVVAFAFGVSLVTGLLFGAMPARRLSRARLREVMIEGGRGASEGASRGDMRQLLIAAEVGLTLVLLMCAALFVESLKRTESVKLGFNPDHLLMLNVDLPGQRYGNEKAINAFYDQLLERLRALPGVTGATLDSAAPLNADWQTGFEIEGQPPFPPGQAPSAEVSVIEQDYFRVMGIPVLSGRSFTHEDDAGPGALIADEAFARRFWPGEDAVGKHVIFWSGSKYDKSLAIIGVVPTVRLYGYTAQPRFLQVYLPQKQTGESDLTILVRSAGDPAALNGAVRGIVAQVDPSLPVYGMRTLEQDLRDSIGSARLMVSLLTFFAALALVMASAGLYGVVAYNVSCRRREIGIRLALGASRGEVVWMMLSHSLRPAAIGIAIGLAAMLEIGRVVGKLLYETAGTDPVILGAASLILLALVVAASYVPARQALRVDPIETLREV
jgi:predicted permease